jgi:hypothetical protein
MLREEQSLRVFENWVVRGVLGSKREEVTGEGKKWQEALRLSLLAQYY